ncbi:MAG: two-component regulator propeller domain-containing protein [Bryobacteraceae bacterium]
MQYLDLPPGSEPARIAFTSLFEDREGSIWLCTDGQGLFRLRIQPINVYSKEQGLPDRNVYPIYQSRDGSLWIGTWSGGLCRFRNGKCTTYTTADGLASNRVNAIYEDRDGMLWVAVLDGLHRMRNGRFEPVRGYGLFSTVRAIHQDRRGVMWFGTGEGLIRFESGRWTTVARKDGLATDDVRIIVDGRDGNLWVGGYGGLSNLHDGHVRAWTEKDGLASNAIRALYEDSDGVLWIGTYDGGLDRFENGRFTTYTVREGLFNNGVFQILEDSRANLWMSCNRGIYRVSKRQLNDFAAGKTSTVTSIAYGRRDGMRNAECNGGLTPAGIKARDGRLWFPTQDGVAVIDPDKLTINSKPPPVIVESCLIDRTPMAVDHPVRVMPGRENFEIQYTALSFISSERIRFKYKMEGLDHDWVDAGTRRVAFYSHVPPGSYTFRLTAANSDGVWNEAGSSLRFVVLRPFYETWWFAFLLSTLAATSLWLGWRYRLGQLKRARTAQQAFSRQLIASQESERKRIAAELHDSLGQRLVIIKNLALLLLQARASAELNDSQRERIEEISTEASGAVREVKEISYNLRPYRLDRLGLTKALEAMIEGASAASATIFSAHIDNIDGMFPQEAEINFYRIVQECVNNILKHSQAARAIVRIQRAEARLILTARDDGRGFAPESNHLDSLGGGFGLIGISERAQLLGGKATIQSAPGQGTTVTIEIDLGTQRV